MSRTQEHLTDYNPFSMDFSFLNILTAVEALHRLCTRKVYTIWPIACIARGPNLVDTVRITVCGTICSQKEAPTWSDVVKVCNKAIARACRLVTID